MENTARKKAAETLENPDETQAHCKKAPE